MALHISKPGGLVIALVRVVSTTMMFLLVLTPVVLAYIGARSQWGSCTKSVFKTLLAFVLLLLLVIFSSAPINGQAVLGCVLYASLVVVFMALGMWKQSIAYKPRH